MRSSRPGTDLLRSIEPLSGLPAPELERLGHHLRIQEWSARSTVGHQGEHAETICFLVSGFAKIERQKGSRHITVGLIGAGEIFGAIAALRGAPRWASLVALTRCTVLTMTADAFHDAMRRNAAFACALAKHLAERLLKTGHQLELMRGPIGARIEALRLEWRALGVPDSVRLSNAEIARMLGCRREVVSRAMRNTGTQPAQSAGERRVAG